MCQAPEPVPSGAVANQRSTVCNGVQLCSHGVPTVFPRWRAMFRRNLNGQDSLRRFASTHVAQSGLPAHLLTVTLLPNT